MPKHSKTARPGSCAGINALAATALIAVATTPAMAQRGAMPCKAHVTKFREKPDLRIVCGGTNGMRLDEIDSYEAATNRATGALAVRTVLANKVRVFLAFPDDAGRPFVQELTRDAALAAGRNADAGIEGVAIDLKAFPDTMSVGVADQQPVNLQGVGRRQGLLDFNSYLTLGRRVLSTRVPIMPPDTTQSAGKGAR